MEASVVSILNSMIEAGTIADTSLILIIIMLLIICYKYMLKPMYDHLFKIPTVEKVEEITASNNKTEELNIDDLRKKLDKLLNLFESIEDLEKTTSRETTDLKRDVETIKQILNQFQGHMMYSGGRQSADFGNRELK